MSLNFLADRTPQRLEFTLEVAEKTLNQSAEVLQTITPISSKVEKWANNMRNNEYSTAAYEQAVLSAGDAGTIFCCHRVLTQKLLILLVISSVSL